MYGKIKECFAGEIRNRTFGTSTGREWWMDINLSRMTLYSLMLVYKRTMSKRIHVTSQEIVVRINRVTMHLSNSRFVPESRSNQ